MTTEPLKKVEIYTDGACSGNPGPGGWAVILKFGDNDKELAGYEPNTTNNRMEITAVIKGLQALKLPCEVDVYSDSAYLVNCFQQGWIEKWKRNGWKTSGKKLVQNIDLWQTLDSLKNEHKVTFHKVQGHAGHEYNERADALAVEQIQLVN
ncbi:MAG: ribonuclease HI [bacterium]